MSTAANSLPELMTFAELSRDGNETHAWLWHGYLAFGSLTLLTSRWKTGKTTLISVLLSRMSAGGMLAGAQVSSAPAIVVSEESRVMWRDRGQRTPFGSHVRWLCRPFVGKPNGEQWLALVDFLERRAAGTPTLIVFDPLAMVLPSHVENNSSAIIDALAPLQQLAAAGHAVLLLHHPRKGPTLDPRGSGALCGFADILMLLDESPNATEYPNRRWLRCQGRQEGLVAERLIELNREATDFSVCDPRVEDMTDGWSVIEWILKDAHSKYTRDHIRENWPEGREKPHPAALWKWLDQAVTDGKLRRGGEGRRHRPFVYWLASREIYFFPDLPPLDFPPYTPQLSQDELKLANALIEQNKEKKRRAMEIQRRQKEGGEK